MWILVNISQDTDGITYAGQPTVFEKEKDAIDSAREQLANDFGITIEKITYEAYEGGTPYILSMSCDDRFEVYTVVWV